MTTSKLLMMSHNIVKLEEDRLLADKPDGQAYMTKSKKFGASGTGQKK